MLVIKLWILCPSLLSAAKDAAVVTGEKAEAKKAAEANRPKGSETTYQGENSNAGSKRDMAETSSEGISSYAEWQSGMVEESEEGWSSNAQHGGQEWSSNAQQGRQGWRSSEKQGRQGGGDTRT